jgi:hypothetical protein
MTALRVAWLLAYTPSLAAAPNLEPRLYLPQPTGRNIVVPSYTYSSGDVVVDGTLPITDVLSTTHTATAAYVRTFGLFGRSAQVQAVAPLVSGTVRGTVAGQDLSRDLRGLADPQLRFAVNLGGGPARRRAELQGVRFGTIVGASLSVVLPLGSYDHHYNVNVSANRWALKPELGVVQPLGPGWALEGYAGVWLFGHNTDFLDTATVTQDPLWAAQGHLIRVFGLRGWLALDGTVVYGGSTSVNGGVQITFQMNVRFGATGGWVVGPGHSLRASFSNGVYTRLGGDYLVLSVGYSYAWGD